MFADKIFNIASFKEQISKYGFVDFWDMFIRTYTHKQRPDLEKSPSNLDIDLTNPIFDIDNIGELYEIALEYVNKISKKELGQYYTPADTANFMATKLINVNEPNDNIADVCCGTGNLIISVLKNMPTAQSVRLIKNGQIYLYDLDATAVKLALMKIAIMFLDKNDIETYSNIEHCIKCSTGNFLDDQIYLPNNCNVISNPPYGKLPKGTSLWLECETFKTNEMYAIFMEKIAKQSKNAVIISPQSFLGSNKFSVLRSILADRGGIVYAFDNVPASIFMGKKHGIFNTNSANSVRAAITIINNTTKGFRITPLLRFKNTERAELFTNLDKFVGNCINTNRNIWLKTPKCLEHLVNCLENTSCTVSNITTDTETGFKLTVPTTPRYFVTASHRKLDRSGSIELYAKDKKCFDVLYVLLNSTFSYLWWRICDGGITLTRDTLMHLPVPDITDDISDIVDEGIGLESECIHVKANAGKSNENIKFPEEYRRKLNRIVLNSLKMPHLEDDLYTIHSNSLKFVLKPWA